MKGGNIFLFGGIILLLSSVPLAYIMRASGAYQAWAFPFFLVFGVGLLLFLFGSWALIRRARASSAREYARIRRERQEHERASLLQRARNLEEARNFEASAQIYERLGMFKEAGRARKQSQVVRVTKTEFSVNLNSLLQQIRDGGIVVTYRCPSCSAPLKISKDTRAESLKVCEHCGSEIEAVDVADFLRTALY